MDKVRACLNVWTNACLAHYNTYASVQLAVAVCTLPIKLLDQMRAGFWERECTSAGGCYSAVYYDNVAFNVIGMRQMADKATDVALLPVGACPASNVTCLVAEVYLKKALSECNHAAYANDAVLTQTVSEILVIIWLVLFLFM